MGGVAVRPAVDARVRGNQGPVRPDRPHESRQDRAAIAHGRRVVVPLSAGYRTLAIETALDWSVDVQNDPVTETVSAPGTGRSARGEAVEMCNVPLPQVRRGNHVPVRRATRNIDAAAPTRYGSPFPASGPDFASNHAPRRSICA
jgi:hypothetical protein